MVQRTVDRGLVLIVPQERWTFTTLLALATMMISVLALTQYPIVRQMTTIRQTRQMLQKAGAAQHGPMILRMLAQVILNL